MSGFRLSPEAEAELDGVWMNIARESGSIDIATRVVENIVGRFRVLGCYPYMGRRRDDDLVLILHIMHGSRDIVAFFDH